MKDKKQFQMWLSEEMKKRLQLVAENEMYSMSSVIHIALEYLFTGVENGHIQNIRAVFSEHNVPVNE